ncbi:MAG: hypothetical protein ABIH46_01300 [Chloroflexota bacterium]
MSDITYEGQRISFRVPPKRIGRKLTITSSKRGSLARVQDDLEWEMEWPADPECVVKEKSHAGTN